MLKKNSINLLVMTLFTSVNLFAADSKVFKGNVKNTENISILNPFYDFNNNVDVPKYGYFYSTTQESIKDQQAVHIDGKKIDFSGIHLDLKNTQNIIIENPGNYYIAWEIFAARNANNTDPQFVLSSPDRDVILPYSSKENLTENTLHISGGAFLEIPQAGITFQLKNVSKNTITTTLPVDYAPSIEQNHYVTASIFVMEASNPITSNTFSFLDDKALSTFSGNNEVTLPSIEASFDSTRNNLSEKIDFMAQKDWVSKKLDFSNINGRANAEFTGNELQAIVEGSVVVSEAASSSVLKALKKGSFKVTHMHSNAMVSGQKTMFLCYKGQGNPQKLAQVIKNALKIEQEIDTIGTGSL